MKYTEFGEFFKILRIKHGEVLADVASFLGASSSLVSSVEYGKRKIPDDWKEKIAKHYNLNDSEFLELVTAIENSQKEITIDLSNANDAQKKIAHQFQRSFNDLDDETIKALERTIERRRKT